jgi:hypothetical protein
MGDNVGDIVGDNVGDNVGETVGPTVGIFVVTGLDVGLLITAGLNKLGDGLVRGVGCAVGKNVISLNIDNVGK